VPPPLADARAQQTIALDELVTAREVLRFEIGEPPRSVDTDLEPGRSARLAAEHRLVAYAADLLELAGLPAPEATAPTVVSARDNGGRSADGSATTDPELREQLMGLGYLN
jgi:hypothetical protein